MDSPSPPEAKRTTIHDLPPEMLECCFEQLSLIDRLRLKSVCKLWNALLSSAKIERLFVDADLELKERWFHSNRPCCEHELCSPNLFVFQLRSPTLSQLKYLKLNNRLCYESQLDRYDLTELNIFRELVQLDIDYYQVEPFSLNLPKLTILSLDWGNNKAEVKVDCPRLKILRYSEHEKRDLLRVEHPETIRVLDTTMFGHRLARFPNLEVLHLSDCKPGYIDQFVLQKLKHLNAIYFDVYYLENLDQMLPPLKEIMRLKRSNVTVYFAGLRLDRIDLADIEFGWEKRKMKNFISREHLYLRYYQRLQEGELNFVYEVDYSRLFSLVGVLVDALPADYFTRFTSLHEVKATCPLDEQHFRQFLANLYWVRELTLWDNDLSQAFFDSLPEICSLTHLCLFETSDSPARGEEIQLNFSFIGELKKMSYVGISRNLSLASLRTLVTAFTKLTRMMDDELWFNYRDIFFKVAKNRPDYDENDQVIINENYNKFRLVARDHELRLESASLAEVIDYFEKFENFENASTQNCSM